MAKAYFRIRILIPLTLAVVLSVSAFVYYSYKSQLEGFSDDVERHLDGAQELLTIQIDAETELLDSIVELLANNESLKKIWLAEDRRRLLDFTAPLLQELRAKHRITHFYFHNPDLTNFLRVYYPAQYGDKITRSTLLDAAKTGRPAAGIELGRLGTLTLRTVHPWHIDGKIVGYIELGEEINHILQKLHDILDLELYVSIYKKFLDQEKWDQGTALFNRNKDWDFLPSAVIVSQSMVVIPEAFKEFLVKGHHGYMEMDSDLDLKIDDRSFRVGVVPLFDVGQREVGDMIILYDVTTKLSLFRKTVLLTGSISSVVGLLLFIIFSTYLARFESTICSYQNNLEHMVEERTEELTVALEEIKTLRGIIPICSHCKQIRDDEGMWNKLESYVGKHSYAEFSHGICPDCYKKHFQSELEEDPPLT